MALSDTSLTALYVLADDSCKARPAPRRPGLDPTLAPAEALTLALLSRLPRLRGERDFYRFAEADLRGAFPTLPDRSQGNRALCGAHGLPSAAYEALDTTAVLTRNVKRWGLGHLSGMAEVGHSRRPETRRGSTSSSRSIRAAS